MVPFRVNVGTYNSDCCAVSTTRRRFLLFVTFDLIFTTLLWIIYTVTNNDNLEEAFRHQVILSPKEYLAVSLFDLVLLALYRFVWLVLLYGILQIDHWWPFCVAVPITSIYLVLKVLFFKWHSNGLEYALVVCSFVIAWVELWLFDFKVIPNEQRDKDSIGNPALLENDVLAAHTESTPESGQETHRPEDYYSAIEYTTGVSSGSESDTQEHCQQTRSWGGMLSRSVMPKLSRKSKISQVLATDEDFMKFGKRAMKVGNNLLKTIGTWESLSSGGAIPILFANHPSYGRLYYLKEDFPISVDQMFSLLVLRAASTPDWNSSLSRVQVIRPVDVSTDVIYTVTKPVLGGSIAPRDYVDVRRWERRSHDHVQIVLMSANTDLMPPQPTLVRAVNGPNLVVLKSISHDQCSYQWIMNTNIKGRIPRRLIDQTLAGFLVNHMRCLRTAVDKLADGGPDVKHCVVTATVHREVV